MVVNWRPIEDIPVETRVIVKHEDGISTGSLEKSIFGSGYIWLIGDYVSDVPPTGFILFNDLDQEDNG